MAGLIPRVNGAVVDDSNSLIPEGLHALGHISRLGRLNFLGEGHSLYRVGITRVDFLDRVDSHICVILALIRPSQLVMGLANQAVFSAELSSRSSVGVVDHAAEVTRCRDVANQSGARVVVPGFADFAFVSGGIHLETVCCGD